MTEHSKEIWWEVDPETPWDMRITKILADRSSEDQVFIYGTWLDKAGPVKSLYDSYTKARQAIIQARARDLESAKTATRDARRALAEALAIPERGPS